MPCAALCCPVLLCAVQARVRREFGEAPRSTVTARVLQALPPHAARLQLRTAPPPPAHTSRAGQPLQPGEEEEEGAEEEEEDEGEWADAEEGVGEGSGQAARAQAAPSAVPQAAAVMLTRGLGKRRPAAVPRLYGFRLSCW